VEIRPAQIARVDCFPMRGASRIASSVVPVAPFSGVAVGRSLALLLTFCCLAACSSTPHHFEPDPGANYTLGMFHCVVEGDTLEDMASYYRRDPRLLVRLNDLESPYRLTQGFRLYIPPDNNDNIVRGGRLTIEQIRTARRNLMVPKKYAEQRKVAVKSGGWFKRRKPRSSQPAQTVASSSTGKSTSRRQASSSELSSSARRPVPAAPRSGKQIDFAWPLEKFTYIRGFSTLNPLKPHRGLDLAAARGTPIHAAADGVVLCSDTFGRYGNRVVLLHGEGFATLYGHNSKNLVTKGQKVKRGQTIAEVGSTGRSTGPHVHFEVRYLGIATNPRAFLPDPVQRKTMVANSKK
jgi:murein DD-endopeptidase MepM/ murein hydrolase activator NlpD